MQAPPALQHTAEAAFDLAVRHGMAKAGHSHTGRALCAVVAECCLLLLTLLPARLELSTNRQNRNPHKPHAQPYRNPQCRPHTPAANSRGCIYLAMPHGMPRAGHSHTDRALCAVVAERCLHIWKTSAFSKTVTPTSHLHSPAAAPSAGSTKPAAHCTGCIWPCSGPWHIQG